MSTTDTPSLFALSPRRGPQWWRAAAWTLGATLHLAVWFWTVAVVVVTVAIVVIDRVGSVTLSIMQFAGQGATWFPFAIALIFATAQIGVHVVNGMTRRSFVRAQLLTVTVSATVYALVMSAAITVEGAVYRRFGWVHGTGGENRATWQDGFAPALLEFLPLFLAAQVSGLLVGMSYYRYGGWRGTFLLPLTAAPVILLQFLAPLLAGTWEGTPAVSAGPVLAASLALIALAAYAFARIAGTVPVRRVTA